MDPGVGRSNPMTSPTARRTARVTMKSTEVLKNRRGIASAVCGAVVFVAVGVASGQFHPGAAQPTIHLGAQVLQASAAESPGATVPLPAQRGEFQRPSQDASTAEPGIDDRVQRLLPHLKKLFRYRDYRTLANLRAEGRLGMKQTFPIPGNGSFDVTPESLQNPWVQLRVVLREGNQVGLQAGIRARPGEPAVFGSPAPGDHAVIVIIWVDTAAFPRAPSR